MTARAVIACLAASPALADDLPFDGAALAACIAGGGAQACIGTGAAGCMAAAESTAPIVAGPCLGEENVWWEARLASVSAALTVAEGDAMDYAAEIGWPEQPYSITDVIAGFEAQRDLTCDYRAALWGAGSGAGPAWMECRMQMVADLVLRLEEWEGAL